MLIGVAGGVAGDVAVQSNNKSKTNISNIAVPVPLQALPPGWEAVEAGGGPVYYWNTLTNTTMWERPVPPVSTVAIPRFVCSQLLRHAQRPPPPPPPVG